MTIEPDLHPNLTALISVSDTTGLVAFAQFLVVSGYTLLATSGTGAHLKSHGIPVTSVETVTQSPQLLDGRVKTLHPVIHAGLLANRNKPDHVSTCESQGIPLIDIAIINLYPFQKTIGQPDTTLDQAVDMIDCGGVAMIRSAAKNHQSVTVIVEPTDYVTVTDAIRTRTLSLAVRQRLASKAFQHTATYDQAIHRYLSTYNKSEDEAQTDQDTVFPPVIHSVYTRHSHLRYGENSHQQAAVYYSDVPSVFSSMILHNTTKALSHNNLIDAHAAWDLARDISNTTDQATCVIIKHTNPCGVAIRPTQVAAYDAAFAADPVSAFGSIIGFNQPVTEATAIALQPLFVEAIIAPGFSPEARHSLSKKTALRLIELPDFFTYVPQYDPKFIPGGVIYQTANNTILDQSSITVPTKAQLSDTVWPSLLFAYTVVKHIKSNAIAIIDNLTAIGIGAGQMSRVEAAQLALSRIKTGSPVNAIAASDAFFPFPDSIHYLGEAGIRVIIQPGGSKKDPDVIAACDQYNIALVMTGIRHFKH